MRFSGFVFLFFGFADDADALAGLAYPRQTAAVIGKLSGFMPGGDEPILQLVRRDAWNDHGFPRIIPVAFAGFG